MTDRQAPTASQTVAGVTAALDQAEAELKNVRAHLASIDNDSPAVAYCASRSASIVAATVGRVADQLRDLAARQSGSVVS